MEQVSRSGTVTLVTLPVEVLVYIFSFLPTRDKVRIRCTSITLRSVGEVPSLWEDFIWSHYSPRDEKLLKNVLKTFGKHIKRIHFADHIAPTKVGVMLNYCKNVIHVSLPSYFYHGNFEKFEKIVHSMRSIQILDILAPVFSTGDNFIRQCFSLSSNLKELSLHYRLSTVMICVTIQKWLEKWANNDYVPRKLNIVFARKLMGHGLTISLQSCVSILGNKTLQNNSDSEDVAWFNIYFKTSTDFSATVPFIQLQVTDSSVFSSSVKASKYGILGLDFDTLYLTEGSYRGKKVHKALLTGTNNECMDTSVASLTSVTYFDASCCRGLYPGHLEQLSIACPNLQRLDLSRNYNCLSNLEGLHNLANNCKSLQGLCLKEIHVHDCEYDCIQLWEILCTMRLTQLAIETCMINICDSRNAKFASSVAGDCGAGVKRQKLNHMFQRYASLQVLEVGIQNLQPCCNPSDSELLLLTNFPSITYYRLCSVPSNNCHHTLKQIFGQKYLRCLFLSKRLPGILSLSLEGHCSSLRQLYIYSRDTVPTETFIDALCDHGELEHVILCVKSLTIKSIMNMIECSANLVTLRVYLYSRAFLKSQLKQLTATMKKNFSRRRLFNGGTFDIQVSYCSASVEVNDDTDLSSVWEHVI